MVNLFTGTAGVPPATRRRREGFLPEVRLGCLNFSRFALICGRDARCPSEEVDPASRQWTGTKGSHEFSPIMKYDRFGSL